MLSFSDGAWFGGFIAGLAGALLIIGIDSCDSINNVTGADGNKIWMVEKGYAHFEISEKGKPIFVLDSMRKCDDKDN